MTNEASVTRDFKHYLEKHPPQDCITYEFKIVKLDKKKSFAFSQVANHQIKYLRASLKGFWYKISDGASINGFSSPKPFDAVWCYAKEAFVVPIFWQPNKIKTAVMIPVNDFVRLTETWPKKSIHMEDLKGFEWVEL